MNQPIRSVSDQAIKEIHANESLTWVLENARARRAEFAENQRISDDVVQMLRQAGIYRALVAKKFGGDEKAPADFLKMIERISIADGSTGWVASFGFASTYLAALPSKTLEEIYAEGPDVVFAGGIFPPQLARKTDNGYEVSGRWSWASGSTGADLIGVGVKFEDGAPQSGLPRTAVMPRDAVSIEPNWNVNGLKGTGSHDVVVDKVTVPEDWIFVRGGPATVDAPIYRYPNMVLAAQVLAAVGLGCARSAIDELAERAGSRLSITGAPVFAQRPAVQVAIAKAEAKLQSARAFFYETAEEAFATVTEGKSIDHRSHVLLRAAATNAAHVGLEVCQLIYMVTGTDGIFASDAIGQALQDAMVVTQHAFLSDGTWQHAGAGMLGLETPPGYP